MPRITQLWANLLHVVGCRGSCPSGHMHVWNQQVAVPEERRLQSSSDAHQSPRCAANRTEQVAARRGRDRSKLRRLHPPVSRKTRRLAAQSFS